MPQRYYSSISQAMSLVSAVSAATATLQVSSIVGLPTSVPFTLVLEPGTASEEIITVTALAGATLTVLRGQDSTAAQAHGVGSAVRHMMTARDLREPQQHMDASADVHGLAGGAQVVGTTSAQTLTNKAVNGANNSVTNLPTTAYANLSVTTGKLAAAAVTTDKLADAAVTTAKQADASVTLAKLAAEVAATLMPVGSIVASARAAAPTGWLVCDGSTVLRATYAALFSAIGTAFNTGGEDSTVFRLPNLKGRVPVGLDAADTAFDVRGETGGAKTHTLTVDEMPSHTHTQNPHTHTQWTGGNLTNANPQSGSGIIGQTNQTTTLATTATNQNTGGGQAHNNLQPYLVLNYLIRH